MKNQTAFKQKTRHFFYVLLSIIFIYGSWILLGKLFLLIPNRLIEMVLTLISLPLIFYIWLEWFISSQKRTSESRFTNPRKPQQNHEKKIE